ncbi:dephospho-CoA kinase/protein folding accessory domain-containing protein [Mycobacteroides abscessus subsp. abscessus]|uniref:GrpB family protein n=1 Tax=Dermabacter vaginalis TaxID=1630135 RepID=UPI000925A7E9|nr:GrpB family protein [Dermabacter vaginalis]MCG7443137.1 GrpB family protein [Dermabacter vaginalis]SHW53592.1 dephospho-CoA kinase/protein folding accessory domain-containing protein [Mycobacteroides abscessus subsp. abscessus]
MAIHLSEYCESWVGDFMGVATTLVDALDGHGGQGIEHIGATSVPKMVARPIIDIAVIAAPLALEEACEALAPLGYVAGGEKQEGEGYRKLNTPTSGVLHALTVFEEDSPLLHASIAARQVLMNSPELVAEFSGYKRGLAFTGAIDVEEYRAAKVPMFQKILREAGMDEEALAGLAASF